MVWDFLHHEAAEEAAEQLQDMGGDTAMSGHHFIAHGAVLHPGTDILALGSIVGSLMGYLPDIAAGIAILWYSIMVWESETVRRWTGRLRSGSGAEHHKE